MKQYFQPIFARGSGIGTRLFPWARCFLKSIEFNTPMLRPNWVQPRIGPLIRGGIDYTSYHRQILLWGLFNSPNSSPAFYDELYARLFYRKVDEQSYIENFQEYESNNIIVKFSGDRGRFKSLNGFDVVLKNELINITKPKWKTFVNSFESVPIGINIRLGNDFKKPNSLEDHFRYEATQTPIEWFVESLIAVRKMIGYDAAAYIVTDGKEEQLKSLIKLPNTFFVRPGCAISDLLILSNSKVLLRSGGSSFSAWASFLGQMPTISHPGQGMKEFNMVNKFNYYSGEFDPSQYNAKFHQDIKDIFKLK